MHATNIAASGVPTRSQAGWTTGASPYRVDEGEGAVQVEGYFSLNWTQKSLMFTFENFH